jgi:hypothetical protein
MECPSDEVDMGDADKMDCDKARKIWREASEEVRSEVFCTLQLEHQAIAYDGKQPDATEEEQEHCMRLVEAYRAAVHLLRDALGEQRDKE